MTFIRAFVAQKHFLSMLILNKTVRYLFYLIGALVLLVVFYLICAFTLPKITVNGDTKPPAEVNIYILTNGVHTDLILPVKTEYIDWGTLFPYNKTTGNDTTQQLIGIGWGDKGFYLNTPTWDDLTFTTAFNAVFGLGGTAIHATYHKTISKDEKFVQLQITPEEYRQLIAYIKQSLKSDPSGNPIAIQTNANYGTSDAFYEASGTYSLFFTCNTWTNNALKSCGQKACWWTPFQSGIFYQYE